MSDRLAVFNDGRIEQIGTPAEVYERPASEFVAGFVGVSNVLERGGRRFTVGPEKIRLLGDGESRSPAASWRRAWSATSSTSGRSRATSSTLDAGGELQVVRQNLETPLERGARASRDAGPASAGARARRTRSRASRTEETSMRHAESRTLAAVAARGRRWRRGRRLRRRRLRAAARHAAARRPAAARRHDADARRRARARST